MKKTISILIPTYNESENVVSLTNAIVKEMAEKLADYQYEIVFIDNHSTDDTRAKLRKLCEENHQVKAILNAKNFGWLNSPYYGMTQTTGDCTIMMCADFQDPVELISAFVQEWENGYRIVIGQKLSAEENKLMYGIRAIYYNLIKKFSDIEQIEQFTGFGLYDKSFIKVMRDLKDPTPYLRGIVAEMGFDYKKIPFYQKKRTMGKSKSNFWRLYDVAMLGFTSYTKIGLRLVAFVGIGVAIFSLFIAVFYFIYKLIHWDMFSLGMAPLVTGMFFLGGIQLIFLGIMGEYIMAINKRVMNHPLVIEEERINFDTNEE